jgi:hypothetical protein
MTAVCPSFQGRVAESFYADVLDVASDLKDVLRAQNLAESGSVSQCLSFVRASGDVTAKVISLISWACAYRSVTSGLSDIDAFVELSDELRGCGPVAAGRPSTRDFDVDERLRQVKTRVDQLTERMDRLS